MERFHLSLNNSTNTNTRLLTNLANVLFELFKKDENEAVEFLKEEGVNIDEFDKENKLFMRKLEVKHEKKQAYPER